MGRDQAAIRDRQVGFSVAIEVGGQDLRRVGGHRQVGRRTERAVTKAKQDLDARINQIMGGGGKASAFGPVAPVPRYGALAGTTGYGQTTVSFGGAQVDRTAEIIAELRRSNDYWRQRATRDEQMLAAETTLENLVNARMKQGVATPLDGLKAHSSRLEIEARLEREKAGK